MQKLEVNRIHNFLGGYKLMVERYQRKIAILLIALLVLPMNLFTSIETVFAEGEELVAFTDFEDGDDTQGWVARGDNEVLTVTTDDAQNGEQSLLIENRLASSDAAVLNLTESMSPGSEDHVSLLWKLGSAVKDTPLQLSTADVVGVDNAYYA